MNIFSSLQLYNSEGVLPIIIVCFRHHFPIKAIHDLYPSDASTASLPLSCPWSGRYALHGYVSNCLLHSHASKRFPGARTPLLHKWHNMLRDDLPGCHRYILIMPSMVQLPAWVYNTWRSLTALSEFMIIYGHYLQVQMSGFAYDKLVECFQRRLRFRIDYYRIRKALKA
jgi:hypothetical protein